MKKFFIVGKNCLLLGREVKKDNFEFSIGETLLDQTAFIKVKKVNNKFLVQEISTERKYLNEALYLLFKVFEKNFSGSKFFIQKEIVDQFFKSNIGSKTISKKYDKLTDVYKDPSVVPWNFMSTEIEDVLSFFNKGILKNKKVLYVGAGYGKNIWAIKDKKYDIDAIEFSGAAVKRANKIFGKPLVIQQDLINYDAGENKYDVILDIGCLHSISSDKRRRAVENIYKLLTKNGILISRIFKTRKKEWLARMPFKVKDFGLDKKEIKEVFKNFPVIIKYQNIDFIILEAKKC